MGYTQLRVMKTYFQIIILFFFINFRFYRRVSNSSVNKSTNSSDIDSSRPNDTDQIWELKKIRLKNPNNVVLGNLNINFISRKFEQFKYLISNHVDVLVLTETKLNKTFATSSFLIDGFSSPFRLNRNRKGGSILILRGRTLF